MGAKPSLFLQKRSRRSPILSKLHLLDLGSTPILEQLQLEEMLLRTSHDNFLILSRGSPKAIVLGISGKPEEHLYLDRIQQDNIPLIRRFSGGGTVIVDEDTLFVTFIISEGISIAPFPEPILRWGEEIFQKSWHIPGFHLIENDYVIGEHKCGGNAQYIQRGRWLHHTSFLWDYRSENMEYLKMPPKRPAYRQSRAHTDFLCRLKHYVPSKDWLFEQLLEKLDKHFAVIKTAVSSIKRMPYRQSVQVLSL